MRPRLRAAGYAGGGGPNDVVEVTNVVGRIFDKSGNVLCDVQPQHPVRRSTDIFSSDPRIEYDTISNRWFISFLTLDTDDISTAQNGFCNLAVSKDSDPLDGFNTYQIETPATFRINRRSDLTTTRS